ncbi:MAG: GNAT family N-acetyltransferase [Chloroflexota bacterium]|nr:GNAT family N-acetyltransferase [Chloroflexota bacterium]
MSDSSADEALLRRLEDNASGAAARGRESVECGPFRALLDPSTDMVWLNYAVPISPGALLPGPALETALADLRHAFQARGRRLRFEFTAGLWPTFPTLLEQAGLVLQARHPLMVCTPADFTPVRPPGVQARLLDGADRPALATFLTVRQQGFADLFAPADLASASDPPQARAIDELRQELESEQVRAALATVDGIPASAGVTAPLLGIAELAGVATVPQLRRRGGATALSSALVRDHFDRGGEIVWISAGDAIAQAVYERIGFRLVGARLNYIAPDASEDSDLKDSARADGA